MGVGMVHMWWSYFTCLPAGCHLAAAANLTRSISRDVCVEHQLSAGTKQRVVAAAQMLLQRRLTITAHGTSSAGGGVPRNLLLAKLSYNCSSVASSSLLQAPKTMKLHTVPALLSVWSVPVTK
jgi:hypothetical protein